MSSGFQPDQGRGQRLGWGRRADRGDGWTGNPRLTVPSRYCPSLWLAPCSMGSSRFVVTGAGRGAGLLVAKRSGTGPVAVRGG